MYGLAIMLLVIRVLPESEYGAFLIVQTIFTLCKATAYTLAALPLAKFAAETDDADPLISASLLLHLAFFGIASVVLLLAKNSLSALLDPTQQSNLHDLFGYLPLLFAGAFYRTFAVGLLQAKIQVQRIFCVDATYFLGTPLGIVAAEQLRMFHTAEDLVTVMVLALAWSTLVAIALTRREVSAKFVLQGKAIREMWNFGKFTFAGSSLYVFFNNMDVFILSSIGGVVAAAVYGAAKIFARLFDMFTQAIHMVLIPYSSKTFAQQDVNSLTIVMEKSICFSTVLILPVFLVMFFFPETILDIFYAGKYTHGAPILRVLSALAILTPWNATAASYLIGMGKAKESFYIALGMVILALPLFFILTAALGGLGTSIGLVVTFFAATLVLVRYIQRFIPLKPVNVARRTRDIWSYVVRTVTSRSSSSV